MRGIKYIKLHWKFYLKLVFYHFRHPLHLFYYAYWVKDRTQGRLPWVTFGAIDWLRKHTDWWTYVIEFGMGGSSRFFFERAGFHLRSVEHDPKWFEAMSNISSWKELRQPKEYAAFARDRGGNCYDIALVDGIERNACIREVMPKIKPGGAIVLDNSERPEYAEGIALLKGWDRQDFWGPGLYNKYFWQTTVFTKPKI